MTRIKTRLTGIAFGLGLTLGLVALPMVAGATEDEATASYGMLQRTNLEQVAGRTNLDQETIHFLEENLWVLDSHARYAMAEPTELERITGRQNLDLATMKFLEENLWDYEPRAGLAGEADDARRGAYAIDLNMFSAEIPWQDRDEQYAEAAGQTDGSLSATQRVLPPVDTVSLDY